MRCMLLYCIDAHNKLAYILFGLLMFVASGIKNTMALVFVCALVGVVFVQIVGEKWINRGVLLSTIISCLVFALVFIFVVGGGIKANKNKCHCIFDSTSHKHK